MKDDRRVKLVFRLTQDEDGYPPFETESVWALRVDDGLYQVDNIPFFAEGLALGDVYSAKNAGNRLIADKMISQSGHRTVRLFFLDMSIREQVLCILREFDCKYEVSHRKNLVAADIPPEVSYAQVSQQLKPFYHKELLDIDDGED